MKNRNVKRAESVNGFTLIELMVTLAVAGFVMTGVMTVFLSQHDSYKVQIQAAALQQNLRAGMKMLSEDIRMAGFYTGLDKRTYSGCLDWNPMQSGMDKFRPVIHGVDNVTGVTGYRNGTDIIMIVKAGDDRGVLISGEGAQPGSNVLEIKSLDLDRDGRDDLNVSMRGSCFGVVVKSDLSSAGLFKIIRPADSVEGYVTAGVFDRAFSKGDLVARADILIYKIDDRNKNFIGSVLSRKNAGNGNSFQVVAEDITDMQLAYILDDGREITDPGSYERRIRSVRILLTGEIAIPGGGVISRTLESMVKIRNVQ